MKFTRQIVTATLLLLNLGLINVLAGDNSVSQEANSPGFQVIGSLIALGIIAFLAPLFRKEKTENQ